MEIIAEALADLTGDGIPERIAITGERAAGNLLYQDLALVIWDGANCTRQRIPLPENAGYDPRLWTGSLVTRGKSDVLVSVASGGSGGVGFFTAYTFLGDAYRTIFSNAGYEAAFAYAVAYRDGYTASVDSLQNNRRYLVDLSQKGAEYLDAIYADDGALLAPIDGGVNPPGLVAPVDADGDGVYSLAVLQRATGLYNADTLGEMLTVLTWRDGNFTLEWQALGILGAEIPVIQPR